MAYARTGAQILTSSTTNPSTGGGRTVPNTIIADMLLVAIIVLGTVPPLL